MNGEEFFNLPTFAKVDRLKGIMEIKKRFGVKIVDAKIIYDTMLNRTN